MHIPYTKIGAGVSSLIVAAGMTGFAMAAQAPANQSKQPQTSSSQMSNPQNENSGYSKDTVRKAQEQLKKDGDYTGSIDGIYGPETRAAVEKYQQNQNLTVNGKLDNKTCSKLGIQNK
jgi:peptidoglycan hydrolase-like protein with peptidoglycan-binding domain